MGEPHPAAGSDPPVDVTFSIEKPGRFELTVKGSRFIGFAARAASAEAAEQWAGSISREYRDATHCCWAWRVGAGDRSRFRTNDAGEPSGTAGRPILEAIDRRTLSDTVCAVVRYFGGRKLGTGGLARAYGECAGGTLDAAGRIGRFIEASFSVRFGAEWTGRVMAVIRRHQARVENRGFQSETEISVRVRAGRAEAFTADLTDATSGKAVILRLDAADGDR
ncbi:YigZ family protein [bacterium]|nr:YigZ family protein [bacterium]